MIDQQTFDLIHAEIDGENSPVQSEELHRYFEGHSDAERYFRDLKDVCHLLDSTGPSEPPAQLRNAILSSLPAAHRKSVHRRWTALLRTVAPTMPVRFGYAMAACIGIVIGILMFRDGAMNPTDFQGTMMSPSLIASMVPVGEYSINLPVAQGSVEFRSSRQFIIGTIRLTSTGPVTLEFNLQSEGLRLTSVSRAEGSDEAFTVDEKRISIDLAGGNDYTLLFHRPDQLPARMAMRIEDKGVQVWHQVVSIAR